MIFSFPLSNSEVLKFSEVNPNSIFDKKISSSFILSDIFNIHVLLYSYVYKSSSLQFLIHLFLLIINFYSLGHE